MTALKSPVFVVGCARSGTSLVYSILLASNEFAHYEAETLLLRTCADKYGKLNRERNYNKFIQGWVQSKQFIRSGLNQDRFLLNAPNHSSNYLDFLDFFMTSIAIDQGKFRWAENTPNHILEITNIAKHFPDARFIHVIRDGRAVASSLDKLNWISLKHPALRMISAGIHWKTQVKQGRKQGKKLDRNYMELFYEELIENPEKVLQELSVFTGTTINLQILENNRYSSLKKNNSVYSDNIKSEKNRIFSSSAVDKWKTSLSSEDQAILNTVTGDLLEELGFHVGSKTSVNWSTV
ncbi:sulfotransferase [Desulfomarina profundi]|uniref:Sulfotransferase n=1 Tax=Desulfomarina profundi TaxID=2772557 RepID=A0A8D5FKL6_9BACT|nr:sulfotransferase [Desulfomarina profundi]BCL59430.1 sulfotransferase [Desulfomarina profundi]